MDVSERLPRTQPNPPRSLRQQQSRPSVPKPGKAARASPPLLHLVGNVTLSAPPQAQVTWGPLFCKCPQEHISLGLNATFNSETVSPGTPWAWSEKKLQRQRLPFVLWVFRARGGCSGGFLQHQHLYFKNSFSFKLQSEWISPPLSQTNHRPPR